MTNQINSDCGFAALCKLSEEIRGVPPAVWTACCEQMGRATHHEPSLVALRFPSTGEANESVDAQRRVERYEIGPATARLAAPMHTHERERSDRPNCPRGSGHWVEEAQANSSTPNPRHMNGCIIAAAGIVRLTEPSRTREGVAWRHCLVGACSVGGSGSGTLNLRQNEASLALSPKSTSTTSIIAAHQPPSLRTLTCIT